MDTKELRLGNIVLAYDFDESEYHCKVVESVTYNGINFGLDNPSSFSSIKPLPLYGELLVALGFTKLNDFAVYMIGIRNQEIDRVFDLREKQEECLTKLAVFPYGKKMAFSFVDYHLKGEPKTFEAPNEINGLHSLQNLYYELSKEELVQDTSVLEGLPIEA